MLPDAGNDAPDRRREEDRPRGRDDVRARARPGRAEARRARPEGNLQENALTRKGRVRDVVVTVDAERLAAFNGNVASALYAAVTRDLPYLQDPVRFERYLRENVLVRPRPPRFKSYPGGTRRPLSSATPEDDGAALGRLLVARRTTREFARTPATFDDLSIVVRATWGRIGWFEPARWAASSSRRRPPPARCTRWSATSSRGTCAAFRRGSGTTTSARTPCGS